MAMGSAKLGIVVPTLDAASTLRRCVSVLDEWRGRDLVVVDGGSVDGTPQLAERLGARVIRAARGRGSQLAAGAAAAGGDWLLFLHADTVLAQGWARAVASFVDDSGNAERAGYFRLALDDRRKAARRLEAVVAWRARALGLPYGDQGLLIARAFYERLGGHRPLPLMEDVDLVRRIGRPHLVALPVTATTSATRYRREGYARRSARNLICLAGYFAGVPPRAIQRLYG